MKKRSLFSLIICSVFVAATGIVALNAAGLSRTLTVGECTEHDLVHYDAVAATDEHPGNIEYWVCCECHKSFSDANAEHEIANTNLSAGKAHIVEGDGRYVPALNLMRDYDCDFEEAPTSFRHNRTAAFDYYPYGNWSDMNGDVGGWYYIQQEEGNPSNMVIKQPAVVWHPGNTTVKKDLSANTAAPGTYEISFDVKVSETAKTAVNGAGLTGNLVGYCWCEPAYDFKTLDLSANWNQRTGELSTTEWTNLRCRYVIPEATAYTFNQFNLIYWPEGTVGEDNYVLVDNIKVYPVVGGVVDESANIDTIAGGDLEMFNPANTVQSHANKWWVDNNVRGTAGTVMDGTNRVFKFGGVPQPVCVNFVGPSTLAKINGVIKVSLDAKKGPACTALDRGINFKIWDCMEWQTPFDTTGLKTDEYTRISQYFTIYANPAKESFLTLWFCMDKPGPSTSADDYILMDNISIEVVYL